MKRNDRHGGAGPSVNGAGVNGGMSKSDSEGLAELESVRVDCQRTCQKLVKAAARTNQLQVELRDVALTLVVLEQRLCSDWPILTTGRSASEQPAPPRPALILGGVASLFHNLRLALQNVEASVSRMPHWGGRASKADAFRASIEFLVLIASASALSHRVIRLRSTRLPKDSWQWWVASTLQRRPPKRVSFFAWLLWLLWRTRGIRIAKLRSAHESLLLMLRLWSIVTSAVEETLARHKDGMVPRVSSFALISRPRGEDIHDALKPMSRKMFEVLPLPSPLPIWRTGVHSILRRVMDVAFGSFGFAWWATGYVPDAARQPIATVVALGVAPTLLLQPYRASCLAAQARARMVVGLCRAGAWVAAENRLVKAALRFWHIPRCVKWRRHEVVDDTPVTLFCQTAPGKEERPIVLFFHGGGFVANLLTMDLGIIGRIAALKCAPLVVVPEYPLAVDHPYPCALDACVGVYRWVRANYHASRLILVGESAGGNLALATMLRLLVQGADSELPDGAVCGYPTLHMVTSPSPSRAVNVSDPLLSAGILKMCADVYIPKQHNAADDFQISPAVAPNDMLRRLPPLWLQAGGLDPLLDDAVDFAVRLRACQVFCELKIYRGLPHGFWSLDALMPEAAAAVDQVLGWVESALADTR